ncbi:histidinol-phosphatase HisJ family protein, partial [candidate division WOR-3 bacterium]|nr:histidinol-phosphatase HisJ family protein [candidate division WOR-3 bacterium]MBD3365357.1 histidinol-phosphatase HisJ family protein [candidate division WOR-3 bacterium]
MIDLHIHTAYSPDSAVDPETAARVAVARELKIIGFADHAEFVNEDEAYIADGYKGRAILDEILKLRKMFRGQLEILFGVEIGFIPGYESQIAEFLNSFPFDYSIGSVHWVEGLLVSDWTRKREAGGESYLPYYKDLLSAASSGLFQVLGHLDYVRKYLLAPEAYDHAAYELIIDEILEACAETGTAVEINTSGWRHATE